MKTSGGIFIGIGILFLLWSLLMIFIGLWGGSMPVGLDFFRFIQGRALVFGLFMIILGVILFRWK